MVKQFLRLFTLVASIVIFFDQLTKFLINWFQPQLQWGLIAIHVTQNTGAGFGILQGKTIGLAVVSLFIALVVIFNYDRIAKEKSAQILFALFLGGVVGNFIDRLFRGYVIDFIDIGFWPTFNIADAAITVSAFGLLIYYWKK